MKVQRGTCVHVYNVKKSQLIFCFFFSEVLLTLKSWITFYFVNLNTFDKSIG